MSQAITINLIPRARQMKAERRRRLRWWGGAWGAYAAALALAAGVMYLRFGIARDLSAQLQKQGEQIASLQSDRKQTEAQLRQVSQKLLSAKGLLAQPDWSQLMSILADLRGNDVVLSDIELKLVAEQAPVAPASKKKESKGKAAAPVAVKSKWQLQIQGHGKTPESVSQYVLRLERTQLFDIVNLVKTDRDPIGAGDATSFSIECPLKGHGRALQ